MAILNFNAQTVAPNSAFDPLQPGWYHVKIIESETKPVNPPKTGSYLALTMEVIEGPAINRKLYLNLNLENENPVAVRIAYEQLSALCYVTGQIQCQDSQQLHGLPFQVKVAIRPASGQYDASNDVKGFRNTAGVDPKDIASGNVLTTGPAAPPVPGAPTAPGAPVAPGAPAPAAPSAPTAPAAAAAEAGAAHDPLAAAAADGWAAHPTDPAWMFKGSDVKAPAEVALLYPVPAAAAAAPAPAAPTAPPAPAAAPPWAKPAA